MVLLLDFLVSKCFRISREYHQGKCNNPPANFHTVKETFLLDSNSEAIASELLSRRNVSLLLYA